MLALRFYAPEDLRLEDVPEPTCGTDEVKIRVKNCSTCGTDVKIRKNGHQNLTRPASSDTRSRVRWWRSVPVSPATGNPATGSRS